MVACWPDEGSSLATALLLAALILDISALVLCICAVLGANTVRVVLYTGATVRLVLDVCGVCVCVICMLCMSCTCVSSTVTVGYKDLCARHFLEAPPVGEGVAIENSREGVSTMPVSSVRGGQPRRLPFNGLENSSVKSGRLALSRAICRS